MQLPHTEFSGGHYFRIYLQSIYICTSRIIAPFCRLSPPHTAHLLSETFRAAKGRVREYVHRAAWRAVGTDPRLGNCGCIERSRYMLIWAAPLKVYSGRAYTGCAVVQDGVRA